MIQRPRGTRDFFPDELEGRRSIEAAMRKAVSCWGYREIATPAFEHLELFTTRSGEGIVGEMYAFQDKGGRDISLRPELTAPVLRMYVNEAKVLKKPVRWYYMGDCFRYERPQKGRYRQFWQFGVELIGADSAYADAEVMAVGHDLLRSAGVSFELRVGDLAMMRSLLANLDPVLQKQVRGCLDKRDYGALEEIDLDADLSLNLRALIESKTLDDAFAITGPIPEEERIRETFGMLEAHGVPFVQNFGIARGLDYYTGSVFEAFAENLGAENQIMGGGAYRLAHLFGGEDTPSCGFAIGFDRVMVSRGETLVKRPCTVAVATTPEGRRYGISVAAAFRTAGVRTIADLLGRSLSAQLSQAAKHADYVVVIGAREAEAGMVTLRNLATGEQEMVTIQDAVAGVVGSGTC
ncbi:MAG: histidine--tRNA ligase [Methanocalculus sp. MSAO_Arc1]|uniref:histidine--tRNA ligase n=1 Tax=Methanocalculus TaxID=71151 RepID=UPI000FF76FBF|nr:MULTISPECIES: histidine--tRNA ligase [unclassified Methanocalculus]MCP1663154.1 histidyl-tRNA synthetase [Methanocalculus sp. AMF5]RQD79365.1 MAG: histidine--tRNA ligase [Methanocalculus sp. MSAO_Arc1]